MKNRFAVVELTNKLDSEGNTYYDTDKVRVFASFKAFSKHYFPEWNYTEYMRKSKLFRLELARTNSITCANYIDTYYMNFGRKLELYKFEFIK